MAVDCEVRDRVAYVTLNRPEALNGIDEQVLARLGEITAAVADDESVKAVAVTGAGDAFCVGLDIGLLGAAFDDVDYFASVVTRLRDVLCAIEDLPVPVVAAANGLARAGGFELLLACDIVVAASEARIGDTHATFGILPGGGASARAPRRLGPQRARDLLLTGRWMTGPETVEYGLAARCVPRADLDAEVEDIVGRFRDLSRPCVCGIKRLLRDGEHLGLREAIDLELERFVAFLRSEPSSREGYQAYVEKRKPSWT